MTNDSPSQGGLSDGAPDGDVPFGGYTDRRIPIPVVEALSDEELAELNGLLPWSCFVVDSRGRRFGSPAGQLKGEDKRPQPQMVPDKRTLILEKKLPLAELTVLEIGCFEGVHTTALAQRAKLVKACDSRVVNLVKTAVRCAMFQVNCTLFHWDVEKSAPEGQDISCDVLHHVGVLYHLQDPVGHLRRLLPSVGRAVLLDTHYSTDDEAIDAYDTEGGRQPCRQVGEGGVSNVFSGMYPIARWLTLGGVVDVLKGAGFHEVEVQTRMERHGPRVLILALRDRGA